MFLLTYSMFYPYVVCYPSFLLFSHSESAKRNLYNNHVKYILKESPFIRFDLILNKEFHVSLLRSEAERSGDSRSFLIGSNYKSRINENKSDYQN